MNFICYPKCSTCKKALDYLNELGIEVTIRNIKEDKLNEEELKKLINMSGKEAQKFFNTSGLIYKNNNLKEKTKNMCEEDKIKLLSTDGMLVKRPILVDKDTIIVGFKKEEYDKLRK